MTADKTILVIGTYDTKDDELAYLASVIRAQGGAVLTMDVSVLGNPSAVTDISKHDVAAEAGSTIEGIIALGDENSAMQVMADGAARLAARLHVDGRFDAALVLGGTMGTDLALDVCGALPLGVPKYVVSTVSFSPLIQPERLAPDIQMILWAGGLYGLNDICRASLSQAAGAVLGAARAVAAANLSKPLIGMTSLGSSCLAYMKPLTAAFGARGYDTAVFHSTGMGGRAFESLTGRGAFDCVFDLCLQEFGNGVHGSVVNSGSNRLRTAGQCGVPQIVAPGAADMVDLPTWQPIPLALEQSARHVHNRLISSVMLDADARRTTARGVAECLNTARAPVHLILPLGGVEEWDRPGAPLHAPDALAAFFHELRDGLKSHVAVTEVQSHINDAPFVNAVVGVFDDWLESGIIKPKGKLA